MSDLGHFLNTGTHSHPQGHHLFILVKIAIMWLLVRGAGLKDGVTVGPLSYTLTLDNSFYWENHVYFHIFIYLSKYVTFHIIISIRDT